MPEEELEDKHEEDLEDAAEVGAAPAPASARCQDEQSLEEDSFKT